MNWIDYAILGIVCFSALVGLARGLIRELLSLGTWIAALLVAWFFHQDLAAVLSAQIAHPLLRIAVAFIVLVIAVLILGALLGALLSALIDKAGLSGLDHLLGMLFGGARGVVIVAMAIYLAALTPAPSDPTWHESRLISKAQAIAQWLLGLIPPEFQERLKQI
ncbi:CvpA family protein [Caldichromatium japonicum]|uniref:CvpA family protein n=1 Tax=Caldichromatium japonicum TaxID=2699430 RepID=A0A6G7VFD3_9GAMM|nr:CvpA family protein [Caldichromatium japonicum]QIK38662.1 CvpA family protein [Caldichromatium japonicum]